VIDNPAKSGKPKSSNGYGNPELADWQDKMNKLVGQVQRLDTGHPISDGMKGKSTPIGNYGDKCCSHRFPHNEHQLYGVPIEQSVGKLTANSGKAKLGDGQANPDLAGDLCLRARVETLHGLPHEGKEKVHSHRKLWGESASPAPTRAALTQWRWVNPPNQTERKASYSTFR